MGRHRDAARARTASERSVIHGAAARHPTGDGALQPAGASAAARVESESAARTTGASGTANGGATPLAPRNASPTTSAIPSPASTASVASPPAGAIRWKCTTESGTSAICTTVAIQSAETRYRTNGWIRSASSTLAIGCLATPNRTALSRWRRAKPRGLQKSASAVASSAGGQRGG